jgi:hypothetical protein
MTLEEFSPEGDDLSLGDLLGLAMSEPDQELLYRYAKSRSTAPSRDNALTPAELKWVETNLSCNPLWQDAWPAVRASEGNGRFGGARRTLVGTLLVFSMVTMAWMNTLYDADLSGQSRIDHVLRDVAGASRALEAEIVPGTVEIVLNGGWNLSFAGSLREVEDLLQQLEVRFNATADPFQRGEIAYWLASLNETTGHFSAASHWYTASLESRSTEYRDAARRGAERISRRSDN